MGIKERERENVKLKVSERKYLLPPSEIDWEYIHTVTCSLIKNCYVPQKPEIFAKTLKINVP